MGPVAALEEAVANLREDGWSKDAVCNKNASRHRVSLLLNPYREEALELKLGLSRADLESRVR